jgi:cytochrome c5
MRKVFFILPIALILAACSGKLMKPTQTDADRIASAWPGTTLTELQEGKTLYKANCGKCHELHSPTTRGEDGWRKIVPIMAKKARVDAGTETKILKYLVAVSGAAAQ